MVYDGVADKKHQNNKIHCKKSNFCYFWACQFVKTESIHLFKLRKSQLPEVFASVDLFHQMTGHSLYVRKNWFEIHHKQTKHTHTHTYTYLNIHTHN